eukprot:SAG22_NODE_2739_length_2261_cov_1.708603_2_plen_346_part_00
MPSCLADIARGMESCFVYLQRDTGELGVISVNAGEHFEIHGNHGEPKLRIQADFGVAGIFILADLQVVGGSGDGSQMTVEVGGDLTLERVQMEGGSMIFAGVVALIESSLIQEVITGSSSSKLSLSGGTITGSTIGVTSGRVTVDAGSVLTDSPISIDGEGGTITTLDSELKSDGSVVLLTVEPGAAATVGQTVFRSMAGDITAVSVAEGASLTVSESRLVGASGAGPDIDHFPCDGTLPNCAGAHAGAVVVEGPSTVTLASPLVCDVETGECLADVCLARGDLCAETGPRWAAGTCVDAVCVCNPTEDGLAPVVLWAAANDGTVIAVCLADDAAPPWAPRVSKA